MVRCTRCDSSQADDSVFCQSCGAKMRVGEATESKPPSTYQGSPPLEGVFRVHSAVSGVVSGPYTEPVLRQYISQGAVSIVDSLWDPDAQQWVMISRSRFAPLASAAASYVRIATTTCPQCGTALVPTAKRSTAGLVLIIVGVLLTPAFGIGVPIWVVGFAMRFGGKGTLRLRCPRCQYIAP
jgi:hypothetical protein